MEGEVETIRALLKGDMGKGCKTAEALALSEGGEEIALVLFMMLGETLVLFVSTLLMLVKCVGEAVTVSLILGGELVGLGC